MRSRRSFLIHSGLLAWSVAFGLSACGAPSKDSRGDEAGAGGESERSAGDGGATGEAGAGGAGGARWPTSEPADGGAAGDAGSVGGAAGAGGEGGAGGGEQRIVCDQTVLDPPDDEFRDTNCDGIDGDASHAVFVSTTGSDGALGTMAAPVRSINHALALAAEKKSAVYVCNGTYTENVVIEEGARIYGGYDCARDWVRVKDRAIVRTDAGVPLTIDSVADSVVIDRLAFRATSANPKAFGESSQAGAISNSSNVTLSHVEFVAGDGAPGTDGTPGATPKLPLVPGGAGADTDLEECNAYATQGLCALNATGGVGAAVTCDFNGGKYEVEGGSGGIGANLWIHLGKSTCMIGTEQGTAGSFGRIRLPGRAWSQLKTGGPGVPGAPGLDGAGASAGIGSLRGALYSATNGGADGTWGEPGRPGSGGSGGMSKAPSGDLSCYPTFTPGSGGGQGGVGGCGGSPATGGGGGGGSIGLVIVNSRVALTWMSTTTGKGGDGGAGKPGGKGQPGGAPGAAGNATLHFRGEDGAPGGDGGLGGASGPGGGGPSIGILYVGTAPKVTEGTFDIGVPGSGGALAGGGAAPVGVTGELYQLPK